MLSSIFERQVEVNVVGSTLKNLNTGWLKHFSVPLPPLEQQQQIVERLAEKYGNDRATLTKWVKKVIETLREAKLLEE